jgi:hypothetical protein
MSDKKTPCECPLAGFCNRHGVKKTDHLHKLCQNHTGYFNMWEKCRGPGQNPSSCEKPQDSLTKEDISACQYCAGKGCTGECRNNQPLPSKLQMAKNLAVATAAHAKTGFAHVTEEQQQARLDICKGCEFYKEDDDRCLKCGCFLKSKSAWKSGKCPIGKW